MYKGIVVSVYKDPYEIISRMVLAPLNQKTAQLLHENGRLVKGKTSHFLWLNSGW